MALAADVGPRMRIAARQGAHDARQWTRPHQGARPSAVWRRSAPASAILHPPRTPAPLSGRRRTLVCCTANGNEDDSAASSATLPDEPRVVGRKKAGGKVNLFDPAASASRFLTRRFGLAGGLTLVGLLAAVEGGELLKAVVEDLQTQEVEGEPVVLPSGITYQDVQLGGGSPINKGDFVGVQLRMTSGEVVVQDTRDTGKLVAFIYGKAVDKYPGLQEGMQGMRRAGKRLITMPTQGGAQPVRYTVEVVETSPAYFQ